MLKYIKEHIDLWNDIKNLMYTNRNIIDMDDDDEKSMNTRYSPKSCYYMFRMEIDESKGTCTLTEPLTASDSLIHEDIKYKDINGFYLYKKLNETEKYRDRMLYIYNDLNWTKASYYNPLTHIFNKYNTMIDSMINNRYSTFIERMYDYIDAWNNFIKAFNELKNRNTNNDMESYNGVKKTHDPKNLYRDYGKWPVNSDDKYPYTILEVENKSGIERYETLIEKHPEIYGDKYFINIRKRISELKGYTDKINNIINKINPPL